MVVLLYSSIVPRCVAKHTVLSEHEGTNHKKFSYLQNTVLSVAEGTNLQFIHS